MLLGLDFDGTLAPIVDEPGRAQLPPHTERVLHALVQHERLTVALISGRQRSDLQERVGIAHIVYAGNHGFEISGDGFLFIEPHAAASSRQLTQIAATLTKQLQPIPGTLVEDKGLTVSVHYRQVAAKDRAEVRRLVQAAVDSTTEAFQMTLGNKVYEIRPRVRWNKAMALAWIKEKLGQTDALTIYLGDDATDEDVFISLADGITIKIGDSTDTAARYLMEGPAEVHRFLEWLNSVLRQPPLHSDVHSVHSAGCGQGFNAV